MQQIHKPNPLTMYMRQPKIYISLPSDGAFWPPKSIDIPENKELPIYSMTAKDELAFKTPDALMNGQAVVDVIQSCVPNIKNAWQMPLIDFDAILIAIRLATYGENMSFTVKVPVTEESLDYAIDLRVILDQIRSNITWQEEIEVAEGLTVFVKPLTYKHMTHTSIKAFETQRIMTIVNDDKISDDEKIKAFNTSFATMTQVTVDLISESISKIKAGDTEVVDTKHIKEFIANADKEIFNKIKDHLDHLKSNNEIKPLIITTSEEQREQGAPETFQVPLNFNNSDFFG